MHIRLKTAVKLYATVNTASNLHNSDIELNLVITSGFCLNGSHEAVRDKGIIFLFEGAAIGNFQYAY